MILSAQSIHRRCCADVPLIYPFVSRTREHGVSYGLSSAGYDVRVEFDSGGEQEYLPLYPGKFVLASTIERFIMPNDIAGIVHDKSSWARRGLAVQNTVIEPGWKGWLTLELTNHSEQKIILQRGMGIAQVVFHLLDEPTDLPYEGKYQDQDRGPVANIMY